MDSPPLRPWCVALSFADNGPIWASTVLAPTSEAAVAIFSHACMQQAGPPQQPLYGVAVTPIAADWLRTALRAVEGKLPPGGTAEIVSLVPPASPARGSQMLATGEAVLHIEEFGPPIPA